MGTADNHLRGFSDAASLRSSGSQGTLGGSQDVADTDMHGARSKRDISALLAAAKNGLFGVLFVIIKDSSLSKTWIVIGFLVEFLQLLAFAFNAQGQGFPWSNVQSLWLQRALRPFLFETYVEGYRAVFYVVVGVLLILLVTASSIAYSFSRRRHHALWQLKLLRNLSTILSTVLFMPSVGILASKISCHDMSDCWTGVDVFEKMLAILVGLAFIALALLTTICFSDPDPSSPSALSRPHSRIDLYYVVVRAVLTITFPLVRDRWVTAAIFLAGTASAWFLFVWYQPYYHAAYSSAQASLLSIVTWCGVCLMIALAVDNPTDNQAFIFFALGAPLVPFASLYTMQWRRNRLDAALWNDVLDSPLDLEFKIRLSLMRAGMLFEHPGSPEKDKIAAELNGRFREAGVRRDATALLHIFWSNHLQYGMGNKQLALAELQAAEAHSPRLDEQFFIYRRRKMAEDEMAGGNGDVLQFIAFQTHLARATESDIDSTRAQVRFWEELLKPQPSPAALNKVAKRIGLSIATANKAYKALIRLNPNAPQTLRMYAGFLMGVVNDDMSASIFLDRAAELDEFTSGDGTQRTESSMLDAMGTPQGLSRMLMDGRTAIVTVSGDLGQEGSIVDMNASACRLLGYRQREILGRNVSCVIPAPFSVAHASYIRKYLETGAKWMVDGTTHLCAVHKSGYAVPIAIHVRQVCSKSGGIVFLAVMAPDESDGNQDVLIVGAAGGLITCTPSCATLLGTDIDEIERSRPAISASRFLPDVAAEMAASESASIGEERTNTRQTEVDVVTATNGRVRVRCFISFLCGSDGQKCYFFKLVAREDKRASAASTHAGTVSAKRRSSYVAALPGIVRDDTDTDDGADDKAVDHYETFGRSNNRTPHSQREPTSGMHADGESQFNAPSWPDQPIPPLLMQKGTSKSVQFHERKGSDSSHAEEATRLEIIEVVEVERNSQQYATPAFDSVGSDPSGGVATARDPYAGDVMSVPSKGRTGFPEAASSNGSGLSSSVAPIQRIRQNILNGSGQGLGRLGVVFAVCLFLTVTGIIALAAVGTTTVNGHFDAYASGVADAVTASKLLGLALEILTSTRMLVLQHHGLYDFYNETSLTNRLYTAGYDLSDLHEQLAARYSAMPAELQAFYTQPTINAAVLWNGNETSRRYNMWDLLDLYTQKAVLLSKDTSVHFDDRTPEVWFISINTVAVIVPAIIQVSNLYESQAQRLEATTIDAEKSVFIASMAFIFAATIGVLVPLLALIERRQTRVIWMFLSLKRSSLHQLLDVGRRRLESREALEEGYDDNTAEADPGQEAQPTHDDAVPTAPKGAPQTHLEQLVSVHADQPAQTSSATSARVRRRGAGRPRTVPKRQKIALFVSNQRNGLLKIAAVIIASVVFFAIVHNDFSSFMQTRNGAASSIKVSARRSYATGVSFHLLRELVVDNTTTLLDRHIAEITAALDMARQSHTALLYGNASMGIRGTASDGRFRQLMYYDACIDSLPSDCPTIARGIIGNGLSSAIFAFLDSVGELLTTAAELPIPTAPTLALQFFQRPDFRTFETLQRYYLIPALDYATTLYMSTLNSDVKAKSDMRLVEMIAFCCVIGVAYVIFLLRMPRRLSRDARKMQSLLLSVPPDMLRTAPSFQRIVIEYMDFARKRR